MVKIKLFSDLHLEFVKNKYEHVWTPQESDKDQILCLAGDISEGMGAQNFIEHASKHFKSVIYLTGNHEFYGRNYYTVLEDWDRFEQDGPKNFFFLNNQTRIIEGIRFFGGTMWTSLNNGDPMTFRSAKQNMEDYNSITFCGEPIQPIEIMREHGKFMTALIELINTSFDGKTVVISHHSPGNIIRRKGRFEGLIDHCFYADIEQIIGNSNISLWFHGHLHENQDYMINETRVLCNPYGYPNYVTNGDFQKDFLIEI